MTAEASQPPRERTALRDLARALARAATRAAVYERVVDRATEIVGAHCAALYVSRGDETFVRVAETGGAHLPERFTVDDVASDLWEVALGRACLGWTPDTPLEALPVAGERGFASGLAAGFGGREVGLLLVGEPADGGYAEGALERLEVTAALAGTAVANARLLAEQRDVERLLAGAVETSAHLVGATSPEDVYDRLLEGLVERMGLNGAALWQAPAEGEETTETALVLTRSAGLPAEVAEAVATLSPRSVAARLAHGVLPAEVASAAVAAAETRWPNHPVHLVALPAPAEGVLGIYVDRELPPLIGGVLANLAQAVAAAEQQAILQQRARTIVDSLQRELRPATVELPAGADVGWVYRSATRGVEVGGDFYDVFATASGHVGVACGDVSGKGVEAASLTALAVHTLRACALEGARPREVLTMVNGTVCKQTAPERFMTLAYARVDPRDWSVSFSLAGHPPPLHVRADGARVVEIDPDLPIGIDETAWYGERGLALGPGEALVLVTDGVTEARHEGNADGLLGIEGVAAALAEAYGQTAQELADAVWHTVQEWTGGRTADDCAIVVLRRGVAT